MTKLIRTSAVLALSAASLTAMAAGASAEVIDFEDGNFSFATVKTDDGGDLSVLSVEEFNGSKQLKIDVQDCSLLPKILFNMNQLVGDDHLSDINKIEMDMTIASKDGTTPPGWFGGCIGTAGANDTPAWDQTDYEGGEYENPVSETMTIERKFLLPTKKFVNGTEGSNAQLMRWGTEVPYVMYIDNIKLLDKDGNVMALAVSAPAAEEAAPAEEAAVVEESAPVEEAAPAADSTTTSTTTGNTSASVFAALAVAAAAAAVVSRRK